MLTGQPGKGSILMEKAIIPELKQIGQMDLKKLWSGGLFVSG